MIDVLLITEYPPDKGAISDYVYHLLFELEEDLSISVLSESGEVTDKETPDSVKVVGSMRDENGNWTTPKFRQYDVVHIHNLQVGMINYLPSYLFCADKPALLMTLHDVPKGFRTRMILSVFRNCVFLSNITKQEFDLTYPLLSQFVNQFSVPYFGISRDIKSRVESETIETTLDPDATNIICPGFVHRKKGFHKVVECLPRVTDQVPDIQLTIAGGLHRNDDEKYLDSIRSSITEYGVEERVNITGLLPTEEHVNKYIYEADAVALPYDRISQSTTLAKSIALGTIPVVTPLDSLRPIIKTYGGIMIRRDNASALAAGLHSAVTEDHRLESLQIRRDLSWEHNAERYLKIYDTVCDG
jgi:glycosyltransferase involved in cell wall biosynthesis